MPTPRRATASDIPTIFTIRTSVRENHMSRRALARAGITPATIAAALASRYAAAWLTHDETQTPVAFAMARSDEADVFALFVLPHAEHRGHGTALLATAEHWLATQGITQAWLLTGGEPHLRAPGFYTANGWHPAGHTHSGERRFTKHLPPQ
jgi:GNAT superfamily N-acetyltransferase